MKEEEIKEVFEAHCKNRFPREGAKKLKNGFDRNNRIDNSEALYRFVKGYDFIDCYASVYSFSSWDDNAEIRKNNAVFDTILFDLDSKDSLTKAYLEAKKLVNFFIENGDIPRVYFSGFKGFHVYIDFKPISIGFEAVKKTAMRIIELLKLQTADTAVIEPNRVSRLPMTIHSTTKLYCTPLPLKFFRERFLTTDILNFAKKPQNLEIEVIENDWIREQILEENEFMKHDRILNLFRRRKIEKLDGNKKRLLNKYLTALKLHGRLTKDEEIAKRHGGNEHKARLFLNILLVEAGFSDDEIVDIFRSANDFNEQKTRYQVRYNREWLKRKKMRVRKK